MDKILITGANGFVGSHLIDYLMKMNYDLYAIDRPDASFKNLTKYTGEKVAFSNKDKKKAYGKKVLIPSSVPNLTFLECDLQDRTLLEKIISDIKPKFLFHFGAQPYILPSLEDPVYTFEINVIGTLNIFEPIKKNRLKTRVIQACSAAEYGTTTKIGRPLKEVDPLNAVHPYGISKVASELLARQYFLNFGMEIINLRFFNLTGLRRTNDAASDFIKKIVLIDLGLADPLIEVGNLNPYRDYLDIQDAIKAIWLAAKRGIPGETYNICSNQKLQIRTLLDIALGFSSKQIEVIENVSEKIRPTDEDVIIGDNSKIQSELGWKPTRSIHDTLKAMYEYWQKYYSENPI